jgi:hypothetical protein
MAVAIHNGTKVWQRRDRKTQFATWGVYLIVPPSSSIAGI